MRLGIGGYLLIVMLFNIVTATDLNSMATNFVFEFYRQAFDENQNILVSPLSIRILIAQIYQKYGRMDDVINAREIESIKIVNKLFYNEDKKLNRDFEAVLDHFNTSQSIVDFDQRFDVAETISDWISSETDGTIKNLVSGAVLSVDTRFLLTNAISFESKWRHPFELTIPNEYNQRPFQGIHGVKYQIPTMVRQDRYCSATIESTNSLVLEIPLADDDFKFWIMFPSNANISQVVSVLSSETISGIAKNMTETELALSIPVFEVESMPIDGKLILEKMGLEELFDGEIPKILKGENTLIEGVSQKSRIRLDPHGVSASSASYLNAITRTDRSPFYVNGPFIYMILTKTTNIPIFIGHFSKP